MTHRPAPDPTRDATSMTSTHEPVSPMPPVTVMSRSTAMAVRRALHALRDGWHLEGRLRDAARMVAEDARRHGLRAEEMLVALEREWGELARTRVARVTGDVRRFAERLVTLCIHEFYAAAGAAHVHCAVPACAHPVPGIVNRAAHTGRGAR